jgi:kynurenine formamidase
LHLQGDIIPVEGLLLDDVAPGLHTVHCLPLKLVGSDGAPARCILIQ